ncbi:MAG TPA: hypothetical protein VFH70_05355 [Acidimicrobiales bacterium]|nr:hypothetical protein [Acidimicrobiales bacterium]
MSEATLGDIGRGAKRYAPFIASVVAIVLVVAFLPGKNSATSSASGPSVGQVSTNGAGSQAGQAGAAGANGSGSNLAADASGANGSLGAAGTGASGAGGTGAAGGVSGGGTAGGANGGSATGPVTPPSPTSDPYCDPATGRVKIPSLYAPPCEPPYNGNNGGSTYPGVSATTITVASPQTNNQAEAQALAAAANDTDTKQQVQDTSQNYLDMFEHHVQTYGRKIKIVQYTSSFNSGDSTAAQNSECQADATKVAKQIKAFISWGDCGTNAYENTLAQDGVLCFCTTTIPASYYLQWAPYVWGNGLPDETQAYLMRAEEICKEIGPYPPTNAGEADLNSPLKKSRVFGLIWPGASALDNTDVYRPGSQFFAQQLQKCGIQLKENVSFPLIDPSGPADAQTLMAKFKSEGISSVIFVGDPLDPIYLTGAATRQAYFPEWIVTGSALVDTAHFGRLYDQQQWKHAFGISLLPDRVPQKDGDAYNLYQWNFHTGPPAQVGYGPIYVFPFFFTLGVSLAGPDLTPYTFQCGEPPYTTRTHSGDLNANAGKPCVGQVYKGMFGYPVSPTNITGRVTNSVISWGSKLWPWDDYNMYDDATLIWWDASASGPDETGSNGNGLYRYLYGGKRYMYGQFPAVNPPWFNTANTQTIFDHLPGPDVPPSYPNTCYYLCNSPGY